MVQIVVSHTAKYSKAHNKNTAAVEGLVRRALPKLCKTFDIPMDIEILIRPIKGAGTLGRAVRKPDGKLICEIDCRAAVTQRALETLAHEFTHLEQFHQKRLGAWPGGSTWVQDDGHTSKYRSPKSYAEYFSQPWEVEARARGAAFAAEHANLVGK